jgi:hypothetical protein
MNELELLRREFDVVPEPDEASTELARAALRIEIEASAPTVTRRSRRRWLRPLTAVAIAAAAAAILLVLVGPFGHGPARVDVASAAYEALAPQGNGIWHVVVVETGTGTTGQGTGMNGGHSRDETWTTTGAPHVVRWIHTGEHSGAPTADRSEQVWSSCGYLDYSAEANVAAISGPQKFFDPTLGLPPDPAATYRQAYRAGHVVYQGTTMFRGVPAYELVYDYRHKDLSEQNTWIVRQDNYYPLRTSAVITWSGGHGTDVLTYPTYEFLPRTPANERQLRMAPHRDMLIVPSLQSKPLTNPTCAKYVKPRLHP